MKIAHYFLAIATIAIFSCKPSGGQHIETLSATEFEKAFSSQSNPQIIDVRTKDEFQQGHIKNALNVDYNGIDFDKKMSFVDKSKPVYVYCFSGGRSSSAAKWLANNGFVKIYDMKGGISSWEAQNRPVETAIIAQVTGWSTLQYDSLSKLQSLVLINFSTNWCPPCKRMAPSLDSLSVEWQEKIKIIKIDAVANPLTVQNQKVEAFPTLILYQSGKTVWRNEGYLSNSQIKKQLAQYF